MFDAKEQAKYYIEKIKFLGKSTNQTLFIVFIPLFFLYLTEIEPRYILGENWITQKNQFHNLKYQSKIINNSFSDFFIGTNKGLNGNHLIITTTVFHYPSDIVSSTIDYNLTGAADVTPNNPDSSTRNFIEASPYITHYMEYYF